MTTKNTVKTALKLPSITGITITIIPNFKKSEAQPIV